MNDYTDFGKNCFSIFGKDVRFLIEVIGALLDDADSGVVTINNGDIGYNLSDSEFVVFMIDPQDGYVSSFPISADDGGGGSSGDIVPIIFQVKNRLGSDDKLYSFVVDNATYGIKQVGFNDAEKAIAFNGMLSNTALLPIRFILDDPTSTVNGNIELFDGSTLTNLNIDINAGYIAIPSNIVSQIKSYTFSIGGGVQ